MTPPGRWRWPWLPRCRRCRSSWRGASPASAVPRRCRCWWIASRGRRRQPSKWPWCAACKGLPSYDDPKPPQLIVALSPSPGTDEKRDALNTMPSRPAYGKALLDAVAAKKIAAGDVSADLVRQLRNLGDKALDQRIGE